MADHYNSPFSLIVHVYIYLELCTIVLFIIFLSILSATSVVEKALLVVWLLAAAEIKSELNIIIVCSAISNLRSYSTQKQYKHTVSSKSIIQHSSIAVASYNLAFHKRSNSYSWWRYFYTEASVVTWGFFYVLKAWHKNPWSWNDTQLKWRLMIAR